MTKEDYMKLSKERLAELLAERDLGTMNNPAPVSPYDPRPLCGFGGYCTNIHRDCVGCPGVYYPNSIQINTITVDTKNF